MQPNNQQQTYQSPQAQQPASVGMQPQPNMTPGQAPIGSGPDTQQTQNPQADAKPKQASKPNSTQNSLLFSEMRENMIIMNLTSVKTFLEI